MINEIENPIKVWLVDYCLRKSNKGVVSWINEIENPIKYGIWINE